jgi:esterase/lipase superfamily enzyme
MSAKRKSNDRRTFIKVLALAAAIVAVVGLSVWWFFDYTKDDGLIYPNVYVFGENLGGMTPEAAAAAIHAQTDGTYSAENLIINLPDGMLALSGIYTASYGFDSYMDEVVYRNSPVDYLAGMPADHPFIAEYNQHKGVVCVGQGAWEMPETTRRVAEISAEKNMGVWVDFWGHDVAHDWDWWYKQVPYFMPHLLGR